MNILRECIIIGGHASGSHVLGKIRDRNYKPELAIIRELTKDGVEIVCLHDLTTDYMEGMNSNGIGIVNAALLVSADEKAVSDYWTSAKKKNASNDGPRIHKALTFSRLSQAMKSLVGYDDGLKGHTIIGNPTSLYSIEMTSKHNPVIQKLNPSTGFDIRTNHGKDHPNAGYTFDGHPSDWVSSKIRKSSAEDALNGVSNYEKIIPALTVQNFDGDSNLNMRRTTSDMRTSSQTLMHLDKLEFIFYLLPTECTFTGIDDRTPANYEPKITVRIKEYSL